MYQKLKEKKQDLITLNSFFLSTLVFILILLFKDYNLIIPNIPHLNTTLSVLYMAILGSLIGFIAIQKANKYVEVSEANIFIYLKPLFGIPLSILLLNEKFSQLMILPIILIGFGIYLNVIEKFESKTPNTKTT